MDSRAKNTVRNMGTGIINKVILTVLPFINRTVIIVLLGTEFTGLNSLFSSILELLNLANLGFNFSIVYSLYKPMADREEGKIRELITIFRKIYHVVGCIVFGIGLILLPFLKYLINGSYPEEINLYILYILYLVNTAISYFLFSYKEVLLIADQRSDILNNIRTIIDIAKYSFQFVVLYITKDFYAYLVVNIISTILTNMVVCLITNKKYPTYQCIKKKKIGISSDLKNQAGALIINRVCDIFRNSFDSIVITFYSGLVVTAIYGNYYYVYNAVYQFMIIISSSMSASIGNSIIKESSDKNYRDLQKFSFIYLWINGYATITLLCLYQPFMRMWVGDSLMLPNTQMVLFCLYFYTINMNNVRNQYISGTGLWSKLKLTYIFEAIGNLSLNFILGKMWGVTGILLASIITIFFLNFIWRTVILFKNYFNGENIYQFFGSHLHNFCATLIALVATYLICSNIRIEGIMGLLLRLIICVFIPNLIMLIIYLPSSQFKESVAYVFRLKRIWNEK